MSKTCTWCSAITSSEDELQLHYLISCPGYDTRPHAAERHAHQTASIRPNTHVRGLNAERALSQSEPLQVQHSYPPRPTPRSKHKRTCFVKFMWFPQAKLSYPKVTLLASFESGNTELLRAPNGEFYESDHISVEKGTFEGQLLIGESLVQQVKTFTIEKDDDVFIESQFKADISAPREQTNGSQLKHTMGSNCYTTPVEIRSHHSGRAAVSQGPQCFELDSQLAREKAEQESKDLLTQQAEVEKRAREKAEQDLKESKDRIAALENQMEEYVSARKAQQAEYKEMDALRRINTKLIDENAQLKQENYTLSAEMKSLLEERGKQLALIDQLQMILGSQHQEDTSQQLHGQMREVAEQRQLEMQSPTNQEQWQAMKEEQWQPREPRKLLDQHPTAAIWQPEPEHLTCGGGSRTDYSRQPEQREMHSKTHNEDMPSRAYSSEPYGDGRPLGSPMRTSVTGHKASSRGGAGATLARSLSSTGSEQQPFSAQVNTRNGTKTILLCKLTNPRKGMKVVAKRQGGEFYAGTIQYVGKVDGFTEDNVGIELDLEKAPSTSKGDGTFKNGKQYFKCAPGYGIYIPLAKVFVEQRSSTTSQVM